MNTTVVIVDTASRTVLWLALIGSGLKLALTVAPRFQIAAPKAPAQPKGDAEPKEKAPAAEAAKTGPGHLEVAS